MGLLARWWDTCAGLVYLLVLVARTGFSTRGAYWQWRTHTAFGNGMPPRAQRVEAVLDYARWIATMRRAAR